MDFDFDRCFALAIIYDKGFREFCKDLKSDFLEDWGATEIFKIVKRLMADDKPVTFGSVASFIERDVRMSDEKKELAKSIVAPYIYNPNDEFLQYALDSATPLVENKVGFSVVWQAISEGTGLVDNHRFDEFFSLIRGAESKIRFRSRQAVDMIERPIEETITEEDGFVEKGVPIGIGGKDVSGNFARVDDLTIQGGLGKGHICFLTGESKIGKTTCMMNMAVYATLCGHNVTYYSGEWSCNYFHLRNLSLLTGIPTFDVQHKLREVQSRMNGIRARYPDKGSLRVCEFSPNRLTPQAIGREIMMDMKLHAPKLIVVDDLDLLASDRFYKSEIDSVKNNINELIAIGKECDCAVLTASQVGRDAFGKKKVGGQNVAGTINKVFKADLFLMVYKTQEKVRDYFGNEREAVKHYMLVDRNRHGVGGGIYELDVDMASARVFDVLPEGHNLVQHRRVS